MKNLLSVSHLNQNEIEQIFTFADKYIDEDGNIIKNKNVLIDKTVINLFFENSTRTQTSFEIAAQNLGANVITIHSEYSSLKKGESIFDMILTLCAMGPNFLVIRHNKSGAVQLIAKELSSLQKSNISVINAGDGCHEHPSQALTDAFTLRKKFGKIKGLIISICGDILHSRVARSNMILLQKLGAKVRLVAPPTLLPLSHKNLNAEIHYNIKDGIKDCDAIIALRIQKERMNAAYISSLNEYNYFYGLKTSLLTYTKEHAIILHPGPINRDVEISSELADCPRRSFIIRQVTAGVAVRQAIYEVLAKYK